MQNRFHLRTPEADGAVLLKGSHMAEDYAAQDEKRHAPLDLFVHVRAGPVGELANVR